ncbi:hypothetical protein N7499_008793 [Penicillium canescens]|uniref:Transcriptional activator of proteases prtT n=1 Tax=Penicillium canescens TaxID=5083 RepID=A0AAD6HZM8_PENCN|nr:uncharacterized protein N7446_013795 [Penicillium canescens]KAJ5984949.1 hypothetical protein N7522_012145 [Penicillium canescens]KAJ6023434.1 hypothetical protein N7460_013829 [Penicillium canescens]KAJ6025292.1 hypothetical protein N7444_012971 [Penicillium canescens]KAJ6042729.1 hypothetical protein N7446_013795 [Penicillium canescens]KAJ6076812.1 hypothetical protein N7499_008793 [Penicillium canescens]
MPPNRGRASRACTSCRKQKTRCYEPGIPGRACLRCDRLRQQCSLVQIDVSDEEPVAPASGTDVRLERLERSVAALLDRLGEGPPRTPGHETSRPSTAQTAESEVPYKETESSAAPIMVIRDLATDTGPKPSSDIRSMSADLDDLIAPDLALTLITIFLEYYGRWVLFDPDCEPAELLRRVKKSPLLFCACSLIAVRHTSEDLAVSLAPKLYEHARSLASTTLLIAPQPIEFFQAALILSMWSTTVGQVPLSIDSWLLSGFALQHSQSSPLFTVVTTQSHPPNRLDEATMDRCYLWNHLCLAHMHYCVGTSRRSMLQPWQIERCRAVIDSDHAINFEVRMVAEIYLYWTVYEHLIHESVDLLKSVAALQTWKRKWEFVLDQPRSQFLSMGFHFSHLLLYEHALKSKSARARESVVSEMIRHSTAIVQLAMDTVDERTRHLTDHIYHMITFAAIVICRLSTAYQEQVASTHNIDELDSLVHDLVQWLYCIGLPCHAAHTLGNIIAKVHQKLRPRVEASPPDAPPDEMLNDFNYYFPEFLGLGMSADGNWDLLSNMGLFPQSPESSRRPD